MRAASAAAAEVPRAMPRSVQRRARGADPTERGPRSAPSRRCTTAARGPGPPMRPPMSSTDSAPRAEVIRSTRGAAKITSLPSGSRKISWKNARPRPRGAARAGTRRPDADAPQRAAGRATVHARPSNSSKATPRQRRPGTGRVRIASPRRLYAHRRRVSSVSIWPYAPSSTRSEKPVTSGPVRAAERERGQADARDHEEEHAVTRASSPAAAGDQGEEAAALPAGPPARTVRPGAGSASTSTCWSRQQPGRQQRRSRRTRQEAHAEARRGRRPPA